MDSIISIEAFSKLNRINYILIDAGSGNDAYKRYLKQHLEGAFYLDLNKDLAEIPENPAYGGRHPLPPLDCFLSTLQQFGVESESHIIIYDDRQGANAAARLWWMLRAVGIANVQVLDGGLQKAIAFGMPTNSEIVQPKRITKKIKVSSWQLPMVTLQDVKQQYTKPNCRILDVRSTERYTGKSESIDTIAGHIPNAINIPFTNNLDTDGTFKPPEELKKLYAKFTDDQSKQLIVHCGSGVTACHTLLAMDYAGLPLPNLYVGSWSEWSRNYLPIAVEY